MNSEESRLRSFDEWSDSCPVSCRTISANGFYATGNLFEVECHWCHCRISEFDENIEELHISLSPLCEFLINRENCGNIPLSGSSNELQPIQNQGDGFVNDQRLVVKGNDALDLLIEKNRLSTFENWPNPNITPESLAKAGFFYRNKADEVQCAWCKGVIAQWEKQDNAFEEHRRFFPECPRVQLGPLIEIASEGIRDLGIQQISPPKNPKYASLQARLQTYSNWPITAIQRPEDLAQAGLYYQQVDDQVRCFHCNMGLRLWEKEDDPWFEHAKWYPMCEFVRLVKGVNYIQDVQDLTRSAQSSSNLNVSLTMEDAMLTAPVKLALEMGINGDKLRNKIKQKILKTGYPYETIDDLLKAVFDEHESSNAPESSNGSRQNAALNAVTTVNNDIFYTDTTESAECIEYASNVACGFSSKMHEVGEKPFSENLTTKLNVNHTEDVSLHSKTTAKFSLDHKYLEEENRKLKDARLCKVCLDEEVGVVYLPCGHLVTCVQCAPGVDQCPMCRTKIKGFVRTFLS